MTLTNRIEILQKLRVDLHQMEGLRISGIPGVDRVLGPLKESFPLHTFPCAAVHEFLISEREESAATSGFISHLLAAFMVRGGVSFWISRSRTLFPPALKLAGINPDQLVFVDLKKEAEVVWAIDECLKCGALTNVIGEVHDLDFTASRRMQLAAEQSGVTCFVLRKLKRQSKINPTASVSRWKVTHRPSIAIEDLPGVGRPQWNVELLRIRNGRTGTWNLMWDEGKFKIADPPAIVHEKQRKAG